MSQLTPEKALIFRITHVENIRWVFANGLHCRTSDKTDPNYREIGNPELIAMRADRAIPIPPRGTLSDYIPFYFTPYSPMMLNIKTGYNGIARTPMQDIAILVSSLRKLHQMGVPFVFSDRHAYLRAAQFSSDLGDLDRIRWKILQNHDFKRDFNDFEKVERYQAEALIYKHMPLGGLLGIVCYDERKRMELATSADRLKVGIDIKAMPGWYV